MNLVPFFTAQVRIGVETDPAEKVANFGRFGWWPPAAVMAGTSRGLGISGKKKDLETIQTLVIGGVQFTTEQLAIGANGHCCGR